MGLKRKTVSFTGSVGITVWRLYRRSCQLGEVRPFKGSIHTTGKRSTSITLSITPIPALLLHLSICLASLIALAWSASRLISGSAQLALQLRINPVLIGLTVIALGTSAPELVVSIDAAIKGHGDLIIGNVLGSNIANASLALIAPLLLATAAFTACRSMALPLAAVTALAVVVLMDGVFSRLDGLLMLSALLPICWLMFKTQGGEPQVATDTQAPKSPLLPLLAIILLSLAVLLLSSHFLIGSAVAIAQELAISQQVIGLTLIAIGTSVPEIAAAAAAVRQRQTALVLSNLIGSNLLNLLAVMGIAGVIHPLSLPEDVGARDITALVLYSTVLILVAAFPPKPQIARPLAFILLFSYLGYLAFLGQEEGLWSIV